MGKSLKELREKRDAMIRTMNLHYEKIQTALETDTNKQYIEHWMKEIENFKIIIKQIDVKIYNHKY